MSINEPEFVEGSMSQPFGKVRIASIAKSDAEPLDGSRLDVMRARGDASYLGEPLLGDAGYPDLERTRQVAEAVQK